MARVDERPQIDAGRLTGVQETLLIPLYSRAMETRRADAILRDKKAAEIVALLDCDFSRFRLSPFDQLAMMMRAREFDRRAQAFLSAHPSGTVVEIGCGLDTRFYRIDASADGASAGRATWFDLDLPDVIALRRQLLDEAGDGDRCRTIARSALDLAWLDEVSAAPGPFLFLAEGVLPYFEEIDVRRLVLALRDRFPGAELVTDALTPFMARMEQFKPDMRLAASQLHWTVRCGRELEDWGEGIALLGEWFYFDAPEPRLGAARLMRFFAPFARGVGVYHYRLGTQPGA